MARGSKPTTRCGNTRFLCESCHTFFSLCQSETKNVLCSDVTSEESTVTFNIYDRAADDLGFLGTMQIKPVLVHEHTVDQWYRCVFPSYCAGSRFDPVSSYTLLTICVHVSLCLVAYHSVETALATPCSHRSRPISPTGPIAISIHPPPVSGYARTTVMRWSHFAPAYAAPCRSDLRVLDGFQTPSVRERARDGRDEGPSDVRGQQGAFHFLCFASLSRSAFRCDYPAFESSARASLSVYHPTPSPLSRHYIPTFPTLPFRAHRVENM